jgi:hypothetical protein
MDPMLMFKLSLVTALLSPAALLLLVLIYQAHKPDLRHR